MALATCKVVPTCEKTRPITPKLRLIRNFCSEVIYPASRKRLVTAKPSGPNVTSSRVGYELLDVIAGLACSSMAILYRKDIVLVSWITFEMVMITAPLIVVDWLNNWPIGLKLNGELSKFCSQTFLVIISSWSYWLPRILQIASYGFVCLGFFGISTLVAFVTDVIQVATLHLHMCCVIITIVVYGLRLSTSTLWNLFQGMVYNFYTGRIFG